MQHEDTYDKKCHSSDPHHTQAYREIFLFVPSPAAFHQLTPVTRVPVMKVQYSEKDYISRVQAFRLLPASYTSDSSPALSPALLLLFFYLRFHFSLTNSISPPPESTLLARYARGDPSDLSVFMIELFGLAFYPKSMIHNYSIAHKLHSKQLGKWRVDMMWLS